LVSKFPQSNKKILILLLKNVFLSAKKK